MLEYKCAKKEVLVKTISKVFVLISLLSLFTLPIQAEKDKFLIIHLDAVSSVDFFRELEGGSFPNIASLFANGQQVKYGVSLYPGGTEIIIPRLKQGLDNSEHYSVGWGYLDRETGKKHGGIPIFLDMFSGFSRHNQHQFILGLPGLHHLAGLSLLNIERLWENHDVVEFFWFHTDATGHFLGKRGHLNSIKALDYYLGVADKAGKLDGANLVIYTDHGMTMDGVEVIRTKSVFSKLLADELLYFNYPNVYLETPEKKGTLAKELVEKTTCDLALIRLDSHTMGGYFRDGYFQVKTKGSKFAYEWWGRDYFGYDSLGYSGAYLSKEEWLSLTREHLYPAVPPNIANYLSNPYTGDIVAVLDRPQIPYSIHTGRGNHNSLTNTDLLVPLLYVGPAFQSVEPFEEFWLHELYTEVLPMINFDTKPQREYHSLSLTYPLNTELEFSPSYRWKLGLSYNPGVFEPRVSYDLYRSFLTRVWVGTSWSSKLKPYLEVEAFLGKLSLVWKKVHNEPSKTSLNWRLLEKTEIAISKNRIGLKFLF